MHGHLVKDTRLSKTLITNNGKKINISNAKVVISLHMYGFLDECEIRISPVGLNLQCTSYLYAMDNFLFESYTFSSLN